MALIQERGEPFAFYEAALLVETGMYKLLDALVVVSCSVRTQMERVMERDGFEKDAAAARIASQYPLEEKLEAADYVIHNDATLDHVRSQTFEIIGQLCNKFDLPHSKSPH